VGNRIADPSIDDEEERRHEQKAQPLRECQDATDRDDAVRDNAEGDEEVLRIRPPAVEQRELDEEACRELFGEMDELHREQRKERRKEPLTTGELRLRHVEPDQRHPRKHESRNERDDQRHARAEPGECRPHAESDGGSDDHIRLTETVLGGRSPVQRVAIGLD
jgi:hypothetical protein